MITTDRQTLVKALMNISRLYPDMRFGQLLEMAALLGSEDTEIPVAEIDDEALMRGCLDHEKKRLQDLQKDIGALLPLPEMRVKLLQALEDLASQHANYRFGDLVGKLAALAHVNLYDIEDQQLCETCQSNNPGLQWFDWYVDKLDAHSTIGEQRSGEFYRCPCCHFRTLSERGGFEICPVCYWEDDGQDDADVDCVRGGPNGRLSLSQARENYGQLGASDARFVGNVRPPKPEEK